MFDETAEGGCLHMAWIRSDLQYPSERSYGCTGFKVRRYRTICQR